MEVAQKEEQQRLEAPQMLVAFVDILGFSEIIKQFDKGELPGILNELQEAIEPAAHFMKMPGQGGPMPPSAPAPTFWLWKECLDTRLFSDCLCAAAPLEYKGYDFFTQFQFMYMYLATYQELLMGSGFFTRGAITIGSHYASENMIFSGGLVETYTLETKSANFPRIILSEKLKAELAKYKDTQQEKLNYMLVEDGDGFTFLNHFNTDLTTAKELDKSLADILPGQGITDTSFEELSLRSRNKRLEVIRRICETKLAGAKGSVADKYLWFLDFIDYVSGSANRRRFKDWC
jgi:hypothetical protein